MKVENVPLEDLIPYARNSRTHSDQQVAQVAASIREFGFTNPVLIGKDNDIIAGHGRVLAARKLALDKVPCIRLGHLTETQKRAYVIADNKLALNSGWDEEMLAVELEALKEENFDLDLTGFDGSFLNEKNFGEDTQTFAGKGKNPLENLESYLEAEAKTFSCVFSSATFEKVVSYFENKKNLLGVSDFSQVLLNICGIVEDEDAEHHE
jgi:hypothetical protein